MCLWKSINIRKLRKELIQMNKEKITKCQYGELFPSVAYCDEPAAKVQLENSDYLFCEGISNLYVETVLN